MDSRKLTGNWARREEKVADGEHEDKLKHRPVIQRSKKAEGSAARLPSGYKEGPRKSPSHRSRREDPNHGLKAFSKNVGRSSKTH